MLCSGRIGARKGIVGNATVRTSAMYELRMSFTVPQSTFPGSKHALLQARWRDLMASSPLLTTRCTLDRDTAFRSPTARCLDAASVGRSLPQKGPRTLSALTALNGPTPSARSVCRVSPSYVHLDRCSTRTGTRSSSRRSSSCQHYLPPFDLPAPSFLFCRLSLYSLHRRSSHLAVSGAGRHPSPSPGRQMSIWKSSPSENFVIGRIGLCNASANASAPRSNTNAREN